MRDISKDIKIRVATTNDVDKIYNLMKSVYDGLEDKTILFMEIWIMWQRE